jgi:hypothetical protein
MIDCPHWQAKDAPNVGLCAIRKYAPANAPKSRPWSVSAGTCRLCLGLPPITAADQADTFHQLWNEFHARPLTCDLATEPKYLDGFCERVAVIQGCSCGSDCIARLKRNPPDLSSRYGYAFWQWQFHDGISADLGRPRITFEAAARIRGWESLIEQPSMAARSTIEEV